MTDERKVFEHIESATVLKPGDRVLLTVSRHWSGEELLRADEVLRERFPDVEFVFLSEASAMIMPSGLAEENTDD